MESCWCKVHLANGRCIEDEIQMSSEALSEVIGRWSKTGAGSLLKLVFVEKTCFFPKKKIAAIEIEPIDEDGAENEDPEAA